MRKNARSMPIPSNGKIILGVAICIVLTLLVMLVTFELTNNNSGKVPSVPSKSEDFQTLKAEITALKSQVQ